MNYTRGQRVRFTVDNLGVTRVPRGGPKTLIPEISVNAGDIGAYVEPMPELGEEGWHIVAVTPLIYVTGYVPVHESMFEAVEGER